MRVDQAPSTGLVAMALLTVYVLWGSAFTAVKVALEAMPPFLLLAMRLIVAGGLLYLWTDRRGDQVGERLGPQQWKSAFFIGGIVIAGGIGGVTFAEQFLPSGTAALVVSSSPVWASLISYGVLRERISWPAVAGLGLGLLGLAVLVHPTTGRTSPIGTGAALVAATLWAVGSVYAPRASLPRNPLVSASAQMLAAGVLLLAAALATGELPRVQWTWDAGLALVYLTIFSSLIGFIAYTWLLSTVPVTLSSTVAYVAPVVAVFLGSVMLHEPITRTTLLATAVILLGVALMLTAGAKSRARRPASAPRTAPAVRVAPIASGAYCDCP